MFDKLNCVPEFGTLTLRKTSFNSPCCLSARSPVRVKSPSGIWSRACWTPGQDGWLCCSSDSSQVSQEDVSHHTLNWICTYDVTCRQSCPAGSLLRQSCSRTVISCWKPLTCPVSCRHAGRSDRPGGGLDDRPEGRCVSVGLLVQPRAVLLDVQRDHLRRPGQVSAVAEVGWANDRPHWGQKQLEKCLKIQKTSTWSMFYQCLKSEFTAFVL